MTTLQLSAKLALPIDAVTQRQAFLGKPGSGKSYAATKEAELMYDVGAQFVALDPVGIWYGLRIDGKGKGLPIPVFGGLHGDVPLEVTSGALMADLIVDRRLTCVLDVSQFEHDTQKARFAGDFIKRFYFRMKAAPSAVHLFLEECQEFVPEHPQKGEEQMLHGFVRATKLGRNFGIGISLITQRPQEVSKKALNLTECLFAFQMTGSHERKAIKDWVTSVGADENILTLLPTLPIAHAHVYSPQWLRISETVKIGEKRTADVSSTPAVGVSAAQGKPLTPVDLAQIREQVAATIEKAKAEDPDELRKEIQRLKREMERTHAGAVEPLRAIEAEIAEAVSRELALERAASEQTVRRVVNAGKAALHLLGETQVQIENALARVTVVSQEFGRVIEEGYVEPSELAPVSAPVSPPRPLPATSFKATGAHPPAGASGVSVSGPQQRMLDALARLSAIRIDPSPRNMIAALSNQSPRSSGFEKNMSTLRTLGLIHYPSSDTLALTEEGKRAAQATSTRLSRADIHAALRDIVSGPQWRMCEALIASYPDAMDRGALAAQSNQSVSSSGFEKNLSTLRTLGLLSYPSSSEAIATELLMPRGVR